jgi:hypothetical protein
VARQSSGRGRAERPQAEPESVVDDERDTDVDDDLDDEELADEDELDEDELDEDELDEEELDEEELDEELDPEQAAEERSAETDALWSEVRIDPVEIALPRGVGYTLRAFRPSKDLATPDLGDREDDFPEAASEADEEPEPIDEEELTRLALASGRRDRRGTRRDVDEDDEDKDEDEESPVEDLAEDLEEELTDEEADESAGDKDDDADEADEAEEAEEAAAEPDEDVPVFLTHRGKLLLFRSAESLVDFVQSDIEHDLTQLDTWSDLKARLQVIDVVPKPEDTYELDLVVENLRGGPDAWDHGLLIQAGEVARDVGYALRISSIISALSAGSPLDNLDEGLRDAEEGGFGSFFARRRLRKIRAETAALGWRTIIGKISALTDWRD